MVPGQVAFRYAWPKDRLRGHLFVYWEISISEGTPVADLLLPYWATIRIPISGKWMLGNTRDTLRDVGDQSLIHGLTSRAEWIGGCDGRAFCIILLPLIWQTIRGKSAEEFADKLLPLDALLGAAAATDLTQRVQSADGFEERVARANQWMSDFIDAGPTSIHQSHILALTAAIANPEMDSVNALANHLGLSANAVARLAKAHFGLSPKLLLRRERFLRMLFTMERRPYAEWPSFIDAQYTDLSHMIRDFKDFCRPCPKPVF